MTIKDNNALYWYGFLRDTGDQDGDVTNELESCDGDDKFWCSKQRAGVQDARLA